MSYESPIDKEELAKALQYDRGQYDKGYEDGRADAAVRKCGALALNYKGTGLVIGV